MDPIGTPRGSGRAYSCDSVGSSGVRTASRGPGLVRSSNSAVPDSLWHVDAITWKAIVAINGTRVVASFLQQGAGHDPMSDKAIPTYTCPVCGFHGLMEPPRSESGGGSCEICPSCTFQFGVTDDDKGFTYDEWRAVWRNEGMPWDRGMTSPPSGWNPTSQMRRIGIDVDG